MLVDSITRWKMAAILEILSVWICQVRILVGAQCGSRLEAVLQLPAAACAGNRKLRRC